MNCREMEERIALLVSGDLGPREMRLVEGHLGICESCARLAAGLRSDLDELRALRAEPADDGTLAAVRLSVLAELESQRARAQSPIAWILASSKLRWAAAACAILLVVVAALRHPDQPATPPSRAKVTSPIEVPPDPVEPSSEPAATAAPPATAEASPAVFSATMAASVARPHRDAAQSRERGSQAEDRPMARRAEIIDSNAAGVFSPPTTLVKLNSSDPDVVLYWLVESNGG